MGAESGTGENAFRPASQPAGLGAQKRFTKISRRAEINIDGCEGGGRRTLWGRRFLIRESPGYHRDRYSLEFEVGVMIYRAAPSAGGNVFFTRVIRIRGLRREYR